MFSHLLFDLDGTLVDPRPGIVGCLRRTLAELGRKPPPPDELNWCIGPPLRRIFARLLATDDERALAEAIRVYRVCYAAEGIHQCTPYPGIAALLDDLRARGYTLRLATSKARPYAVQVLAEQRLAAAFSAVYGPDMDGRRADKAELLAHLLAREGLPGETCLMIGDREHDVLGARANGIRVAGVTWGYGGEAELLAAGADYLLHDVAALRAFLLG